MLLHPKDYINASLAKAKDEEARDGNAWHFIAAQGPLEETASDFWRMVMEQYTKQIVMLTRTEYAALPLPLQLSLESLLTLFR